MKNKARVIYPGIPSAIRPVTHNDVIPYQCHQIILIHHQNQMMKMKLMMIYHRNIYPIKIKRYIEPFNQHDLNDLTTLVYPNNLLNYLNKWV